MPWPSHSTINHADTSTLGALALKNLKHQSNTLECVSVKGWQLQSDMTMEALIKDIIDKALASASGVSVDRMNKKEKIEVVAQMHARGLFLIRGSVERAAASLGITKFTIYDYMDELGISRS